MARALRSGLPRRITFPSGAIWTPYRSASRRAPRNPLSCFSFGAVAQLGEHLVCNQGVVGSNPIRSIILP